MKFELTQSLEILERTPEVLDSLLGGLSNNWTQPNEGENTWSPYDIVGHLIHGERTDWMDRVSIILSDGPNKTFEPFDRFAQFTESKGKSLKDLLIEFRKLRQQSLKQLKELSINSLILGKKGMHPSLGEVNLSQLLSTWTVHDLNHIAQIVRVMAKQYKTEVGPWTKNLGILSK